MKLYLASQSPRRRELLAYIWPDFELVEAQIDERVLDNESAHDYVCRLAMQKAQQGWQNLLSANDSCWTLGSDTAVVYQQHILGKPVDLEDCRRTLTMLSGQTHQVMTAISLFNGTEQFVDCVTTLVQFRCIDNQEIDDYWHSGEPRDKAGSYGIQGIGGKFVEQIHGSYSAVVGLPLCETRALLSRAQQQVGEK
ncbi:Maf family protein [Thalassotalea ponticola]|uniref:Maf family protein n=1 Tax=Thalassotalea ponticola TaxID=1523392 RepID=UPI0025B4A909|nr:Maf family protein [Thalassotalea ponticola]MDN3653501.1 Maf family protein [Thalassotalea ponticola]